MVSRPNNIRHLMLLGSDGRGGPRRLASPVVGNAACFERCGGRTRRQINVLFWRGQTLIGNPQLSNATEGLVQRFPDAISLDARIVPPTDNECVARAGSGHIKQPTLLSFEVTKLLGLVSAPSGRLGDHLALI